MTYRILSLDGGGAWALIEVKALISLFGEAATGHQVLSEFDLVAANSGGSLVLGGLLKNMPLNELLDMFLDQRTRESIFSSLSNPAPLYALLRPFGIGPKYSTKAKLDGITGALGNEFSCMCMPNVASTIARGARADLHILIVGFDYDLKRAVFFRSASTGQKNVLGNGSASSATIAEAIHASTNAPVNYFDEPAESENGRRRYWDGAIAGYNNPTLAAVTEAVVLKNKLQDIAVLSLGTGAVVLPPSDDRNEPPYTQSPSETGLFADIGKLATSIVDDPPDAASFIAHVMTASTQPALAPNESRIIRMNPLVSPVKNTDGKWTFPTGLSRSEFETLCTLDMDAVEQGQVNLLVKFADLWLQGCVANQPIRMDGTTLEPEIGYRTFNDAKNAWGRFRSP